MNIIIIGASEIGTHLCKILMSSGHSVTVIEKDEKKCEDILSKLDVNVIKGNATSPDIMEEAKISTCDTFIAASDKDELNFVAAIYAKKRGVERVISRVEQSEYEKMLNDLDVETINPNISTAKEIDLKIIKPTVAKLVLPGVGNIEILEIEITKDSPYVGKKLYSVPFKDSKPVVLHKKNEFLLDSEDHVLDVGDVIIILCRPGSIKYILSLFKTTGVMNLFKNKK